MAHFNDYLYPLNEAQVRLHYDGESFCLDGMPDGQEARNKIQAPQLHQRDGRLVPPAGAESFRGIRHLAAAGIGGLLPSHVLIGLPVPGEWYPLFPQTFNLAHYEKRTQIT